MRIAFVEGSVFEEDQNVPLDPELQVPHGEENALGLAVARSAPVFAEAPRAPVPAGRLAALPARTHDLLQFRRDRRLRPQRE